MMPSPKHFPIATFITLFACLVATGCKNSEPLAPIQNSVLSPAGNDAATGSEWVGRTVKPFTLPDSEGKMVSLSDSPGKQPVVIIFYRGNWCPFCHAQMEEIAGAKDKFIAHGAKVFAISSEDATALKAMRDRHQLDFVTFLSDKDATAAKQFAGTYPGQATLKPVTLVVGKDSKVAYAYTNEDYKVRATTQEVLNAVAKAK